MSNSGIYQIRNLKSGGLYIGSAKNFEERFRCHRCLLRKGKHHSPHLQRSWIKNGEAAFAFEILERTPLVKEVLIAREQHYIDVLKPRYNCAPRAGTMLGFKMSAESRAKISALQKGKKRGPCTPERNANLSKAQMGHVVSSETRAKLSAALSGKKHKKPRSDEWCEKLSAAQRGKPRLYARGPKDPKHIESSRQGILKYWASIDDETRRWRGDRRRGIPHTEETKRLLSEVNKGRQVWWQKLGYSSLTQAIRCRQIGNSGESPITE